MNSDVWQARFAESAVTNALEQEMVLREMLQEFALASLARHGFFEEAIFHGGTCLRIFFNLPRFSEDLDFLLKEPNPQFSWVKYLNAMRQDFALEGVVVEIFESPSTTAVHKAWLKTNPSQNITTLTLVYPRHQKHNVRIKFEVDTNPPTGSAIETHFLRFPTVAAVTTQDLPSAFATKAHALLCRPYVKGRDWFDFIWFATRGVKPRLDVLAHALWQQGPWVGQSATIDYEWFVRELEVVIRGINWQHAIEDVRRFLPLRKQEGLSHWSSEFFLYHLGRLGEVLR